MEVLVGNYMPGDQRLVEKIVYELKSQGIFDQFRKECFADVDTKPAYQNLRQRVEGSVSSFLKDQSWKPDINKNQVREMLRKTINESGFLETGVERIVDQVVNPKINSVLLPKVEEVVYNFLGIQKPDRGGLTTDLLPNDLEAVSPESEPVDKKEDKSLDVGQDLDESKIEEDESPPFEPLDDQSPYPQQEENSVDSHMSGFSGLVSHESNQSNENKVLQMEQESQMSRNSSDSRLSIVTSDENSKIDICEDSQPKSTKSTDSKSDSNKSKTDKDKLKNDKDKSNGKEKEISKDNIGDKERSKPKENIRGDEIIKVKDSKDIKARHSSSTSKDKSRDRKDSRSSNKNEKDKSRERSKSSSSSTKHSSSSSSRKLKHDSITYSSKDKFDKDRSRYRNNSHKDKDKKKEYSGDSKHKHSSSHSDKYKRDKDRKKSKDDHYSSKDKNKDRRSTDRDSNDGQSNKNNPASSSTSSTATDSQKACSESNNNGSRNFDQSENTTKASEVVKLSEIAASKPIKLLKPKVASNRQEALRLMKIRKQLSKLEKKNQLTLATVDVSNSLLRSSSIHLEEINSKMVETIDFLPTPLQNTIISQDNWDAMEAKLHKEVSLEYQNTATDESCKFFNTVDITKNDFLKYVTNYIQKFEELTKKYKRKLEDNDLKNNNKIGVLVKKRRLSKKLKSTTLGLLNETFSLPLSPADSDKSIDKKEEHFPLKPKRSNVSKASSQRYSSDDLYKPRPTFTSSRRRGAKNVEN